MQCYPRSKCREVMTGTDDQGKPNNKTRMQADCRAIQTADSKDLQCSWMEIGADFECIEKGYANEELGDDLDFKATGECKFNQQYFEFQGLGSSIGVSGIFPLGFAFRVSLFPLCALRFVFGVWRLAFGVWCLAFPPRVRCLLSQHMVLPRRLCADSERCSNLYFKSAP